MLYTKFQGHRSLGSEEGDFLTNFHRNIPCRLNMKFGFNRPSECLFEEKKFENVESE